MSGPTRRRPPPLLHPRGVGATSAPKRHFFVPTRVREVRPGRGHFSRRFSSLPQLPESGTAVCLLAPFGSTSLFVLGDGRRASPPTTGTPKSPYVSGVTREDDLGLMCPWKRRSESFHGDVGTPRPRHTTKTFRWTRDRGHTGVWESNGDGEDPGPGPGSNGRSASGKGERGGRRSGLGGGEEVEEGRRGTTSGIGW